MTQKKYISVHLHDIHRQLTIITFLNSTYQRTFLLCRIAIQCNLHVGQTNMWPRHYITYPTLLSEIESFSSQMRAGCRNFKYGQSSSPSTFTYIIAIGYQYPTAYLYTKALDMP